MRVERRSIIVIMIFIFIIMVMVRYGTENNRSYPAELLKAGYQAYKAFNPSDIIEAPEEVYEVKDAGGVGVLNDSNSVKHIGDAEVFRKLRGEDTTRVELIKAEFDKNIYSYTITGEIKNNNNTDSEVTIKAIYYDKNKIPAAPDGNVNINIQPGKTERFIIVQTANLKDISSYELKIE